MSCDGCGRDIPAMTRVCPYCGFDYKPYNQAMMKDGY